MHTILSSLCLDGLERKSKKELNLSAELVSAVLWGEIVRERETGLEEVWSRRKVF